MKIYRVEYSRICNIKCTTVEANSKHEAVSKAIEENDWMEYLYENPKYIYIANEVVPKSKEYQPKWISVKNRLPPVDEEVMVFTSDEVLYFGHIVDKKIAKDYNGWNIPNVEYWLPFVNPKDK